MSRRKRQVREAFCHNTMNRDGNKCRICGATKDLTAHHITDRSKMPNGGYTMANGITLCPPCHLKAEKFHQTDGQEWEPGLHPDDLYGIISEDFEGAMLASRRLSW
jgi:5-methylcytosine-specific restriction endonuclease McrA